MNEGARRPRPGSRSDEALERAAGELRAEAAADRLGRMRPVLLLQAAIVDELRSQRQMHLYLITSDKRPQQDLERRLEKSLRTLQGARRFAQPAILEQLVGMTRHNVDQGGWILAAARAHAHLVPSLLPHEILKPASRPTLREFLAGLRRGIEAPLRALRDEDLLDPAKTAPISRTFPLVIPSVRDPSPERIALKIVRQTLRALCGFTSENARNATSVVEKDLRARGCRAGVVQRDQGATKRSAKDPNPS